MATSATRSPGGAAGRELVGSDTNEVYCAAGGTSLVISREGAYDARGAMRREARTMERLFRLDYVLMEDVPLT